jgi:integrase
MSKRSADAVARHVDELVRANASNMQPEPEAARWAAGLVGRMRETLAGWGLIAAHQKRNDDADRFLGAFIDRYISDRTDVEQSTRDNYGHARRLLVERFGERYLIGAITAADAERWRRWLLARVVQRDADGKPTKTMAIATVSKHVKRAKTMFDEAVKGRLLDDNPFKELKTGSEANRDRDHFIDRATSTKVLKACPDDQWRLIFALARFGGLRRCELLAITWGDVQWDTQKLRIDSPKTGVRFAPIFPELMQFLRDSFDAAPEGSTRVIHRYHRTANLGTQMNRIIEQAGVAVWEKTFQNLRATRRTELQETFQDHVINAWLGHSSATAAKHYLQVTDEHFAAGVTGSPLDMSTIDIGGVTGGVIPAYQELPPAPLGQEKTRETQCFTGLGKFKKTGLATPLGLTQSPESQENTQSTESAVSPAVSSVHDGDELTAELMARWGGLGATARLALVEYLRTLG